MTGTTAAASALADQLKGHIRQHGPIAVADYMSTAAEAYYAQGDVFGTDGDFTTAPEISQTFGEMIGLWSAVTWQAMGAPQPFRLVECGPGRGTLMADALRAANQVPGCLEAADVHLVERSAALIGMQRKALREHKVTWHSSFSSCSDGPMILLANEFLDALPVRQFEKTENGWQERCVGLDALGQFEFTLRPSTNATLNAPMNASIGDIFETSPAVIEFTTSVAARIVEHGGAALIIDYGHKTSAVGDTLQAVKRHKPHPVLEAAGTADITAHVDFEAAAKAARSAGAKVLGPVEQGVWLKQLGIIVRGALLARGKAPDVARNIESGIRRLTEPDGMGALFKVMAVTHPDLAPLEGFSQNSEP